MAWQPLEIDAKLKSDVAAIKLAAGAGWNIRRHIQADVVLCELVSQVAEQLIDREGLPHLAHLICGWGNCVSRGKTLLDHVSQFITIDRGRARIPQCSDEGDFHPWQTFAYILMVAPSLLNAQVGKLSLSEVARNSANLNTNSEVDLGHFLYTYAVMPRKHRPTRIQFAGRFATIGEIAEAAVWGHTYGGFEVCRKFHLTEGLCAISSTVARRYRRQVRDFLSGQLEVLTYVLGITKIIWNNLRKSTSQISKSDGFALEILRQSLALGDAIENVYYYAGHLIELAAIAKQFNFDEPQQYHNTILSIIGILDATLLQIANELTFSESFYAFAHYRRGSAMFLRGADEGRTFLQPDSFAFRISNTIKHTSTPNKVPRPYSVASPPVPPRAAFSHVVRSYNLIAADSLAARGDFPHFRKILPPTFPRGIHYEFLDRRSAIGVEIHCERHVYRDYAFFKKLARCVSKALKKKATFDPNWYNGCGRIFVEYHHRSSPRTIARAMQIAIQTTFDFLQNRYNLDIARSSLDSVVF